jgi:3',5'-cyclic-nucleotide phosphodiesterase
MGSERGGWWLFLLPVALLGHAACAAGPVHQGSVAVPAQAGTGFELIALGVQGGIVEGDLSCWLLRDLQQDRYLALDAGTVMTGLRQAWTRGAFSRLRRPPESDAAPLAYLHRSAIAGYFISHPHLDHVAGLLIGSPDDASKPIFGLPGTLEVLSRHYFNGSAWPNFADRGPPPVLGRYALKPLEAGLPQTVEGTGLQVTAYPLTHAGMVSSMLLVSGRGGQIAYFGDTGPDDLDAEHRLADALRQLAPFARLGTLRAIVIETSYPDPVPDAQLFGHLTPSRLLTALNRFGAELPQAPPGVQGLTVVISHIKPDAGALEEPRERIRRQLAEGNRLGYRFVIPRQGDRLDLLAAPHH